MVMVTGALLVSPHVISCLPQVKFLHEEHMANQASCNDRSTKKKNQ